MDLNRTAAIAEAQRISYSDTGYFAELILHYLEQRENLRPFYQYPVDEAIVQQVVADRTSHHYPRQALVAALKDQYANIECSEAVTTNLNSLLDENTFTITTAHQPNIFTGPLYFIYKILHAIRIADALSAKHAGKHFVPVYFMGSEDADLDELGFCVIDGKKYQWNTSQTGAVGRMKVDKAFLSLIDEMAAQLGVLPFGNEMIELFRNAYQAGSTIQQSTLRLVNSLFGKYGLIVLTPDDAALKKLFSHVIQKELD